MRHRDQYALLVEGRVEDYFSTNREALSAGHRLHGKRTFSVMRVEPQPVSVGFTDCADYPR
jgi:hypothetical protein